MTNYEKYKDEIEKIVLAGDSIARVENKLIACRDAICDECDFNLGVTCIKSRKEWLNADYKVEKVLSYRSRTEKATQGKIQCEV